MTGRIVSAAAASDLARASGAYHSGVVLQAGVMRKSALGVLLVVAMSGCGGGVSKSGFIAKADEICQEARDASYAVDYGSVDPWTPEATKADLRRFAAGLEKRVDVYGDEARRLRELKPAKDLSEEFGRIVAALEASIAQTEDAARAARRGDKPGLTSAAEAADALARKARKAASLLGLEICGAEA